MQAGTTLANVLESVREIRRESEIPLLLFSYLNPVLHYGYDRLGRKRPPQEWMGFS